VTKPFLGDLGMHAGGQQLSGVRSSFWLRSRQRNLTGDTLLSLPSFCPSFGVHSKEWS
jgi:hypothetical protein